MGEHRLLCGDATSMDAVQTVLSGGLADMVFTDPPYNVDYEGKTAKKLKIGNDTLGGKFYEFLRDACANVLAVTKGAIYICMSSSELDTLQKAFREAGGKWSTFVIWAKNTFTMGLLRTEGMGRQADQQLARAFAAHADAHSASAPVCAAERRIPSRHFSSSGLRPEKLYFGSRSREVRWER